jgi:hypothetical protein
MISVCFDMECLTVNISRAAVENQEQDLLIYTYYSREIHQLTDTDLILLR